LERLARACDNGAPISEIAEPALALLLPCLLGSRVESRPSIFA